MKRKTYEPQTITSFKRKKTALMRARTTTYSGVYDRTTGALVARPGNFIAPKLLTKLKYHSRFSVAYVSGVPQDYQFRLNSIFDPDQTSTGHQPYGFDQLSSIYARYRVHKTKFSVEPFVATSPGCLEMTLVCNNSANAIVTLDQAGESSNSRTIQCNLYQGSKALKGSIGLAYLNGETTAQYAANENTQAAVSANPAEVLNLHICGVVDQSVQVIYSVTLEFEVEFFDQFQLAQS